MSAERVLRVLLFSPVAGRDPLSGDTSYTQALLDDPPDGVEYTSYPDAIDAGTLRVRGRRPKHGDFSLTDAGVLGLRSLESLMRRGVMFREPTWFVTIDESAFDLVHLHLFPLRQIGSHVPVVSSAGYPLTEVYANREGWGARRLATANRLERLWASAVDVHNPWFRSRGDDLLSVYTESFRDWVIEGGVDRRVVRVVGTGVGDLRIPTGEPAGATVGFIGRDFGMKGGDVAVEAFDRIRREIPQARMIVATRAGAVPARLADTPGVDVRVDAERSEILNDVLPSLDVLLAPTRSDCGVPYGILEALQASVPVVASTSRWMDTRLIGPGVRRVDPDPARVAAAAIDLLGGDVLPGARIAARELWETEFSMAVLHRDVANLYRERVPVGARNGQNGQRLRLLVAARPYDLSDATTDGFVERHVAMVDHLIGEFDTGLVTLRPDWDDAAVTERFTRLLVDDVPIPSRDASRSTRLFSAIRRMVYEPFADWEHRLGESARSFAPDVVMTVGPWLDREYRILFGSFPSVHLFEEDLTRMPELAPQSRQARLLRRLEAFSWWRAGMRPAGVAVISTPEIGPASRRFCSSRVELVPFTLDASEWPHADGPSRGDHLLVLGNLAQERNSAGLLDVLRAFEQRGMPTGMKIRLVSGAGFHPDLTPLLAEPWVECIKGTEDPYGEFRSAVVAIVASTRATGFKTTILQAWTAGCPVVSSQAAAATLCEGGQDAVIACPDAGALARSAVALAGDAKRREAMARRGLAHAHRLYGRDAADETLIRFLGWAMAVRSERVSTRGAQSV